MAKITTSEAERLYGISVAHEQMSTGELRFRLRAADGNAYIRTEAVVSGWQNSHSHTHTFETYIVERGRMWLAVAGEEASELPTVTSLGPQQVVTTPVGKVHNVYLEAGTVIHTVKHGASNGEADWKGAPDFDELIRTLVDPK